MLSVVFEFLVHLTEIIWKSNNKNVTSPTLNNANNQMSVAYRAQILSTFKLIWYFVSQDRICVYLQ